eukprot:2355383-Prymnesium_polylepis.1
MAIGVQMKLKTGAGVRGVRAGRRRVSETRRRPSARCPGRSSVLAPRRSEVSEVASRRKSETWSSRRYVQI